MSGYGSGVRVPFSPPDFLRARVATEKLVEVADATPETTTPATKRSFAERWGHRELFDRGFVVTPTFFLQYYARLKPYPLTGGEALFVIHMMEFKWDAAAPFPGYKTLAERMGVSDKMARRHAQSLEAKGYLLRQARTGQTNLFDLRPLFDALLKMLNSVGFVHATTTRPRRGLSPPSQIA
jgi:hypothetical protein